MKKFVRILPALMLTMVLASCKYGENIAYVQDAARDSAMAVTGEFSKGIQANDRLYIYVESQTPEVTRSFNQETNKIVVANGAVMNPGTNAVQGYLVNQDGYIIFPELGKIKVLGMTQSELARQLEERLQQESLVLDPTVTVKLMNFKVCMLGDVARPGQLTIDGERLTIFEALSMAGDMQISGQRTNVMVIREENGQRIIGQLDLTSKDIFDSPYYYLHQNDVVYVEPNMRKKRNAERDPIVMSYISSGLSIVSTLTSLTYYIILMRYYKNR